jgi:ATP-dependent HslUV protease subunit HslV
MGTIVAVKTDSEIAIGCDCLNTFEELIHQDSHEIESCVFRFDENFIGLNCAYALQQTAQSHFKTLEQEKKEYALADKDQVRSFFSSVYDELRIQQRVYSQQQGVVPFESLPMNLMLANRHGIFKVDAVRGVYQYKKFWAVGSAEMFALGSLEATYNTKKDASSLVEQALKVCSVFEGHKNREFQISTIRLPNLKLASGKSKTGTSGAKVLMHRGGPVSIRRGRKNRGKDENDLA